MGHEHVQGVAFPGYYAGSHDEDDLYDLCQEVGVLEVVRCADYQENECHDLIEAGVMDCRGRKPVHILYVGYIIMHECPTST